MTDRQEMKPFTMNQILSILVVTPPMDQPLHLLSLPFLVDQVDHLLTLLLLVKVVVLQPQRVKQQVMVLAEVLVQVLVLRQVRSLRWPSALNVSQ